MYTLPKQSFSYAEVLYKFALELMRNKALIGTIFDMYSK